MVAVVAVETGQTARGESATEEGKTTPAAAAVRKRGEPTPDHPPYSWMIGEAIAALGEDGGSTETEISWFIRTRYPGVPSAHDRFLRHYLDKHVAEGLFVRAGLGRYLRRPDEPALAEVPAVTPATARSPETASIGYPATEAKRGRGRSRKDGSPSPATARSPETASIGSPATEAKRGRGRPRKDGSPPSATPKRRGQPRKLAQTTATDVSGEALVVDNKDGNDAPSATHKNQGQPRELALMAKDDGGTAPTSVTENKDGNAIFTTPEHSTQPCKLALGAADEGSTPGLVADKKVSSEAPSAKCKHRCRPSKSGPVNATHGSAPTSIAKKVSGKAPSTTPKGRRGVRKLTVATTNGGSTPTSVAGKKDGTRVPSASPKLAPVTAGGGSAQASVAGKKDGNEAPPVPVKPHGQPRKLYPLSADELPDNPTSCVLALPYDPAKMPATTKAC